VLFTSDSRPNHSSSQSLAGSSAEDCEVCMPARSLVVFCIRACNLCGQLTSGTVTADRTTQLTEHLRLSVKRIVIVVTGSNFDVAFVRRMDGLISTCTYYSLFFFNPEKNN